MESFSRYLAFVPSPYPPFIYLPLLYFRRKATHFTKRRWLIVIPISYPFFFSFQTNRIYHAWLSIKNRKKHARLLLRMYYIEVISQPFNLNLNLCSITSKHVYLLIAGIPVYFIACIIGLWFEMSRESKTNLYVPFVVYNLQFQTTLMAAGYIRLLLLTIKMRIEAIRNVLWGMLWSTGPCEYRAYRLGPQFSKLFKYLELKQEIDIAFGGHLLLMFSSNFTVSSNILYSLALNITALLEERSLLFYDICTNVIPSIIMVFGLVQAAEVHRNQIN